MICVEDIKGVSLKNFDMKIGKALQEASEVNPTYITLIIAESFPHAHQAHHRRESHSTY